MLDAIELAKHAETVGEIPVAALVVRDGEIIARAHNRRELDKDPTAHAEMLALRAAAEVVGDWRLEGCTVYVTLEPCPMCAGAMWLSRIERCVYGCTDPRAGFLGTLADLSKQPKLNHHYEVRPGVHADSCSALLRSFFRKIRSKKQKTG
jgi:tRNA(adenine34) deaminase